MSCASSAVEPAKPGQGIEHQPGGRLQDGTAYRQVHQHVTRLYPCDGGASWRSLRGFPMVSSRSTTLPAERGCQRLALYRASTHGPLSRTPPSPCALSYGRRHRPFQSGFRPVGAVAFQRQPTGPRPEGVPWLSLHVGNRLRLHRRQVDRLAVQAHGQPYDDDADRDQVGRGNALVENQHRTGDTEHRNKQ